MCLAAFKYLRSRDRAVWFPFDDFDCHEKSFKKYQPKTINYRSYKSFSNERYKEKLINNLGKEDFINYDDGFQRFCHISLDALNKHAQRKGKHSRGNQIKNYRKQ